MNKKTSLFVLSIVLSIFCLVLSYLIISPSYYNANDFQNQIEKSLKTKDPEISIENAWVTKETFHLSLKSIFRSNTVKEYHSVSTPLLEELTLYRESSSVNDTNSVEKAILDSIIYAKNYKVSSYVSINTQNYYNSYILYALRILIIGAIIIVIAVVFLYIINLKKKNKDE